MAEFLLELLSEEMPAGMQNDAREELVNRVFRELVAIDFPRGFSLQCFSTPHRLIVLIENLDESSDDSIEERKGPRIDAPQQALDGFLRSCGMKKEDLKIETDKKGKFYVAEIIKKGRLAEDVLAEILPKIINTFPWPKSMLWGAGGLRWVRPLHSITAILDGKPVIFEVGGVKSGSHSVKDFADYSAKLEKAGIIIDQYERRERIWYLAKDLCYDEGLKLIRDSALLDEITNIVETPFCIMGKIDKKFLDLPPEVLQTSMKTHQKFFSVKSLKTKQIENFITVANKHKPTKEAVDTIRKGNELVLSARLADALFFWDNDLRISKDGMKPWIGNLEKITFHNKLGTQGERVIRIAKLARTHIDSFGLEPDKLEELIVTAEIMKLDLCSDMVKEFPELQGVMGRYYAKHAGYNARIARACQEHYAPLGLKDDTPRRPLSVAMSMSDKLDTLAGFWSVELTPTSSKDPFALRRAALGVIRLILDNNLRLSLTDLLNSAFKPFPKKDPEAQTKLMDFFHERLKIYLRDKHDIPADTIDACRFGQGETDFALLTNRAKALHAFRPDAEFQNLLQGFKRAHNILHAEQKKDGVFYEMPPEPQYFQDPTETELHTALNAAETTLPPLMQKEQFAQMLQTLANLRAPIDAFFTQVQVNSDQSAVRRNRLCLLHKLCSVMKTFADFSRLNG